MINKIRAVAIKFNNMRNLSDDDCKKILTHYISQHNLRYIKNQKIKIIKVKKLFGTNSFSYFFNLKRKINVILGANGSGKSTVFKLLKGLLPSYSASKLDQSYFLLFFNIPFESYEITFEYGCTITVKQEINKNYNPENNTRLTISYEYNINQRDREGIPSVVIDYLDTEDVIADKIKKHYKNVDLLLSEYNSFDKVIFATTNRLNNMMTPTKWVMNLFKNHLKDYENKADDKSLYFDLNNLINNIENDNQYYLNNYFLEIDSYRYIYKLLEEFIEKQLMDEMYKVRTFRKDFKIIVDEKSKNKLFNIIKFVNTINSVHAVFAFNQEDFLFINFSNENAELFEKYEHLDDLIKKCDNLIYKVNLFITKCNELFSTIDNSKIMKFDNDFYITDSFNHHIILEDLSSGEKNIMNLLITIIFKSSNNSIVVIDEPEISLHIMWQNKFLNIVSELISILGYDNIQVIIVTHSPFILYGNNDLIVKKEVVN